MGKLKTGFSSFESTNCAVSGILTAGAACVYRWSCVCAFLTPIFSADPTPSCTSTRARSTGVTQSFVSDGSRSLAAKLGFFVIRVKYFGYSV